MASFKLNVARVLGCPPPKIVAEALESFGLPEGHEFGVLNVSATDSTVFATVVRRTQTAVPALDADAKEITSRPVERAVVYPFGLQPARQAIEVYAGSAKGAEHIGDFLTAGLGLPVTVEAIELDLAAALEKLQKLVERFQLVSLRVTDYAHNSYMSGPYAPKFLDSQHGLDFLAEYGQFATAAKVRFQAPTGRATASLTPKAAFGYSCNDEDHPAVQAVLRKLV